MVPREKKIYLRKQEVTNLGQDYYFGRRMSNSFNLFLFILVIAAKQPMMNNYYNVALSNHDNHSIRYQIISIVFRNLNRWKDR